MITEDRFACFERCIETSEGEGYRDDSFTEEARALLRELRKARPVMTLTLANPTPDIPAGVHPLFLHPPASCPEGWQQTRVGDDIHSALTHCEVFFLMLACDHFEHAEAAQAMLDHIRKGLLHYSAAPSAPGVDK